MKQLLMLAILFPLLIINLKAGSYSDIERIKILKASIKIPDDIPLKDAESDMYLKVERNKENKSYEILPLKGKKALIDIVTKELRESNLLDSIYSKEDELAIHIPVYDWRRGAKNNIDDSGDSIYVSNEEYYILCSRDIRIEIKVTLGEKYAAIYRKIEQQSLYDFKDWEKESKTMNLREKGVNLELIDSVLSLIHIEYRGESSKDYNWIVYKDSSIVLRLTEYKYPDTIYRIHKMSKKVSWRYQQILEDQNDFIDYFKNNTFIHDSTIIPKNPVSYKVLVYDNGFGREYSIYSPCSIAENTEIWYYDNICRYLKRYIEYYYYLDK